MTDVPSDIPGRRLYRYAGRPRVGRNLVIKCATGFILSGRADQRYLQSLPAAWRAEIALAPDASRVRLTKRVIGKLHRGRGTDAEGITIRLRAANGEATYLRRSHSGRLQLHSPSPTGLRPMRITLDWDSDA